MRKLNYANVVSTIALFLALTGGVVYASAKLGNKVVKSQNIATHAVKNRNLAKNAVKTNNLSKGAVTGAKVKTGTLTRARFAKGTLAGVQVAEAQTSSVPALSLSSEPPNYSGTSVPLAGTTSFTPVAGKSYELLTELKGNPTDADGPGENKSCYAWTTVELNGHPVAGASIYANAGGTPPFNFEPNGGSSVAVAMQEGGQLQTISAVSFGGTGCGADTTASLRIVVIELG